MSRPPNSRPLRIAALIKQVPRFEAMALGDNGRLIRDGLELELNPYCRRAVAKGAELAAATGGSLTVMTLGPPAADDSLREALAWADHVGADTTAVHVTDPVFAGSDTLATARALAAALTQSGPFDLILTGRNSVDADTGQVGPEVAQLLDLPFLTAVRTLAIDDNVVTARCEYDDGFVEARVQLPAVLSTAERLCEPAKVDPPGRAAVDAARIRRRSAADLGPGPWGQAGSPTAVGPVRVLETVRERRVLTGPVDEQVRAAVAALVERGALTETGERDDSGDTPTPNAALEDGGPLVAVVVEPDRARVTRELLGTAARLGHAVAITVGVPLDPGALAAWGAGEIVVLDGVDVEEDAARGVAEWAGQRSPWAVLVPSTVWGREVAARAAAQLGAGLTGDAVELERDVGGRLVAWKPAFGGQLVAAITCSSDVQMATVRAGVLPLPAPRRDAPAPLITHLEVAPRRRVHVLARERDDDIDVLATATTVVGVGTGVSPDEYPLLEPLLSMLGAELAATRKVTDKGWLPRARQVGITGRSIAPRLYIALGVAGKFNHVIGVRGAGTVLAVNRDPEALVFDAADIGITADWHDVLPLLVTDLAAAGAVLAGSSGETL